MSDIRYLALYLATGYPVLEISRISGIRIVTLSGIRPDKTLGTSVIKSLGTSVLDLPNFQKIV